MARAGAPVSMVRIPAGTFLQGRDDAPSDEKPRHPVRRRAFDLDPALVTRAAFLAFVEATGFVTTAERAGGGHVAVDRLR